MRRAVSELERHGVDRDVLDGFVNGDLPDLEPIERLVGTPGTESHKALSNLIEACILDIVLDWATEEEQRAELATAVPKLYLRELSELFPRVVQRASSLKVLEFADPQLNEASRCYLYGFFRGAIVLGASALESSLRGAVSPSGIEWAEQACGPNRGYFNLLVDAAESEGVFGPRTRPGEEPPLASDARTIFEERTKVVHKNFVPTRELAEALLMKARQVIGYIRERRANASRDEV